ncbi:MAG: sugar phosphate isomerase/epimerase family protein [Bacteroidia bacterium]
MTQIGIFARTFSRPTVLEVFQAAQKQGFQTLQYNMTCSGLEAMPDAIDAIHITEIQAAREATGLSISGLSATYNMLHADKSVRAAGIRRIAIMAEQAKAMGTNLLTLCTGSYNLEDQWVHHPDNNTAAAWADMSQEMEKLVVIAERFDLYLGVEIELGNVINTSAKAQKLIEQMGDRIKILLDPANLFDVAPAERVKSLITDGYERLAPHIAQLHAKDRSPEGAFVAPGRGVVPFDFFMEQAHQAGVTAPLVAHGFPESEVDFASEYLQQL